MDTYLGTFGWGWVSFTNSTAAETWRHGRLKVRQVHLEVLYWSELMFLN